MQILKFRAAGLFPPVPAHERERWELAYGDDVRAFTREHPIDINGPPPNERILKDWAECRQVRATQKLSPVIDAHPAKARGGKPPALPLLRPGIQGAALACRQMSARGGPEAA